MADIRPFQAYRPKAGMESKIAALPYDVYNTEEARAIVEKNPLSFLAIDRAETQFPVSEGVAFDDPRVYEKARELLNEEIHRGCFIQDAKEVYYIWSQTWNGRTQTGIVAVASIDDYQNGVIKKHENTREDKEQDRIRHVDTCDAQTGPIFLAYRSNDLIDEIVERNMEEQPVYDFMSDGDVRNRVWIIEDGNECQLVQHGFSKVQSIYIADGHHRAASAVKVGLQRRAAREKSGERNTAAESDYFLSVLFPEDQLAILDYNRVLKDLNGHSAEELLSCLKKYFFVSEPQIGQVKPSKKGEFGLLLPNGWYRLLAKQEIQSGDPVDGLDVSLLQKYVLQPFFGIEDPRTDARIDFVGGIRGLSELERRVKTDCTAAFAMYPTSIGELFAVADAGRLMPPKSTWFEPKLLSGLFIHRLH
jgi:uncharacterized protein (DUF1015 family)